MTSDPAAAPGVLLQQADIAMYEAKTAGRDGFRIFDSDLRARAAANYDFAAALRKAIDNDELFLVYQPIFSLERPVAARGRGAGPLGAPPNEASSCRRTSYLWPRNAG